VCVHMSKLTREIFRLITMIARLKVKEIDGGYFQAVEHVV